MDENGWDNGQGEVEIIELDMNDRQYRDYKSGVAKKRFNEEVERAKDASMVVKGFSEEDVKKMKRAKADPVKAPNNGQILWEVSVEGPSIPPQIGTKFKEGDVFCYISTPWGEYEKIYAPYEGYVIDICANQGETVQKGRVIAYFQRENKAL